MRNQNSLEQQENRGCDFGNLLKDVPEGDWVAISEDETRVLAHGPNLNKIREEVPTGIIIRKTTITFLLPAMA